jgi:predicted ester cyclase
MTATRIEEALGFIFRGIGILQTEFSHRRFTIDGRLVGDIGEIIAAAEFDIPLDDVSQAVHDGRTASGLAEARAVRWWWCDPQRPAGRVIGLSRNVAEGLDEIPDLHFNIQMLISDPPYVASRLGFDCTPKGTFLGLHVGGKRVSFTENVFYEFRSEKIREVWSVIDKAAIEAQL